MKKKHKEKFFKRLLKIYDAKYIISIGILISIIIILIDSFDLISKKLSNIHAIMIIFLIILSLLIKNLDSIIKLIKSINKDNISILDKYILTINITLIILLFYTIIIDYKKYKLFLIFTILLATIIYFFMRISIVENKIIDKKEDTKAKKIEKNTKKERKNKDAKKKLNVLELKDIYINKVELNDYGKLILLNEKEIDYDLLDRTYIINKLYNTITNCNTNDNFTIGLNGKWGSGKTTIINNILTKLNKNDYVIVKFDPWEYNDTKVMIKSLIEKILNQIEYYNFFNSYSKIIDEVFENLFDENEKKYIRPVIKIIKNEHKENNKLEIIRLVNDYLEYNDKKMIIIVDNLDRIDASRADILIKLIEYTLDFKETINILLYDEDIMKNAFNSKYNFNNNYMEKLIQLKINVPSISKNTINSIVNEVFNNITYNKEKILNIDDKDLLIFHNIREFKNYINTFIALNIKDTRKLNKNDRALLLFIENGCPDLYNEIKYNEDMFTTYGRSEFYLLQSDKKIKNEVIKKFFFKLDEKYKKNDQYKIYLECLKKLFPNYNKYSNNKEIFETYNYADPKEINRICDKRCFELYFTESSNKYTKINLKITKFIDKVNKNKVAYDTLEKIINNNNVSDVEMFFQGLYLRINEINDINYNLLIKYLVQTYYNCDKHPKLMFSYTKERIINIIAKIFSDIHIKDQKIILDELFDNFKDLLLLYETKYRVVNSTSKKLITNKYNELCNKILNENINIYDEKIYKKGKSILLYKYAEDKAIKYFKKILDDKNIYYFLNDLLTEEKGENKYIYSMSSSEKMLEKIKEAGVNVKKLLDSKEKLNSREKVIYEAFTENKEIERNSALK